MSVTIEILSGPDRGKSFPLEDDLTHLGRGTENTIVLNDPIMEEFQATIARNGKRYELYTELSALVTINGATVTPQQWIPLTLLSRVYLGGSTEVRLRETTVESSLLPAGSLVTVDVTADVPDQVPPLTTPKRPPRKESKRQVAKLIPQSKVAETLGLGLDGKYPELSLASTTVRPKTQQTTRESNPVLLFTILAASVLVSAALLLVDFEAGRSPPSNSTRLTSRTELQRFYGKDARGQELYQKLLRQASVAHSQGQRLEEQKLLKQVLSLLNAFDTSAPENLNGLTGRQTGRGKAGDQELRDLIEEILASEG